MCIEPGLLSQDVDVFADIDELPAVVDMVSARTAPPALVHDEWGDNIFLETLVDDGACPAVWMRLHFRVRGVDRVQRRCTVRSATRRAASSLTGNSTSHHGTG